MREVSLRVIEEKANVTAVLKKCGKGPTILLKEEFLLKLLISFCERIFKLFVKYVMDLLQIFLFWSVWEYLTTHPSLHTYEEIIVLQCMSSV